MEDGIIQLRLGDWLYNAGIVGIVNILEHEREDSAKYAGREVSFDICELENFEEKFFNYFIDTYEPMIAWKKVISYKSQIEVFEGEKFQNFNEKSLEEFNKYIENLKRYLKSNSHVAAYELIEEKYPVLEREKELKKIQLKKKELLQDKIPEIKLEISKIKEIIRFYEKPQAKKYIAGKNVIYNVIRNGWNGVSILNPQTKEKNMYKDYKKYFPQDALNYMKADKSKFKYECFNCHAPIENLNIEMGFLNASGFDSSRKPSHVWNYYNDIAICPVCKLVYSCVPAGFTYVYNRGIFVNANNSASSIVRISQKMRELMLKDEGLTPNTTYKSLIAAIQEKTNDSFRYELSDIQVVRYENEVYRFNILSRQCVNVVRDSKKELDRIIKSSYKEGDEYIRLYEEVVKKLFNNENQFLLIHRLLVYKLSKPNNEIFYNVGNIMDVITINFTYLKGITSMRDVEKEDLKAYSRAGYYLKKDYKNKHSENKLKGITYRLLNALKTNNQGMFMDTILNCYLYIKKQVPYFFTDCLKDKERFKMIGYSFVSGLIDGEDSTEKVEENINGK